MRYAWLWLSPLALIAASLIMTMGPHARLARIAPLFDREPATSLVEAEERLARFGPEGLALYWSHLRWDVCFAIANALVLGVPIAVLGTRLRWRRLWIGSLLALPALFVLLDIAENIAIGMSLNDSRAALIVWAGGVTRAKFMAFGVTLFAVVIVACTWLIQAGRSRKRGPDCVARPSP